MLGCNVLFFVGTWKMHVLQVSNVSPVVGISTIWIYSIGYVVGCVMGIMNMHMFYRLLTGRLREDELFQVVETESLADIEKQIKELKA